MNYLSVLLLSMAFLPLHSFADTSSAVTLSATAATQSVQVTDQQYAPVYGQVAVQTTCTQQVIESYTTQCNNVYDTVCATPPGGTQTCTQVPRVDCEQVPVYGTEDYPCTQYETEVVGQTLVKTFNHTIHVSAATAAILAAGDLDITINVSQGTVTAQLNNSYPSALLNFSVAVTSDDHGSDVENLTETLTIDVAANAADLAAFNADSTLNLALGTSALRVSIPGAANLVNDFKFDIRIQKHRTLWLPTDLVKANFDSANLGLVTQGADINSSIALSKLGITTALDNSQFSVWVTVTLKSGNYLNPGDFSGVISKQLSQTLNKVKTSF